MGNDTEAWCKYHWILGDTTDNYWRLTKEIDKLTQEGKLRGYAKGERGGDQRRPLEQKNEENHKKDSK